MPQIGVLYDAGRVSLDTEQLVLVDPIGLEDWKAKGVPSISVDQWYQRELQSSADRMWEHERTTYYAGTWKDSDEA